MKYKPARYKKNRRCAKRREIYDRIIPVSVEVAAEEEKIKLRIQKVESPEKSENSTFVASTGIEPVFKV